MRHLSLAMALLTCGGGFASQSYKPPASGEAWVTTKCYLKSPLEGSKAQGVAIFLCNEAERQHRIQLFAKGLEPGRVYSLWLLAEDDGETRARRLTRRVWPQRTDRNGEFRLLLTALECEVAKYERVIVRYHPPGSRVSAQSGEIALVGQINREAHNPASGP